MTRPAVAVAGGLAAGFRGFGGVNALESHLLPSYFKRIRINDPWHAAPDLNGDFADTVLRRLLEAQRPRAAFHAVHLDWSRVETSRLKRLLLAVATVDAEPADWYRLDAYRLSEALDSLQGRTGVSLDEMAQLSSCS